MENNYFSGNKYCLKIYLKLEKGEIYVTKKLRKKIGIVNGGFVKVLVKNSKLIIELIPRIEDLIKKKNY